MERKTWTLLAIAAGGDSGLEPVELQKSLFLLGEYCREEVGEPFYEFEPWDYGPFDPAVYDDARELEGEGLVSIGRVPGRRWSDYRITRKGAERAEALKSEVPARASKYLSAIVAWAKRLSFAELVTSIYARFPQYKANSIFQA